MDFVDAAEIQSLQPEQLWHLAMQWSPEQWKSHAAKLNPDQIPAVLPAATEEHDPHHWKEKTCAIFEGLNTPLQLEAAGRVLSNPQVNVIASWAASSKEPLHEKLFPLFIGMPHQTFLQLLLNASPDQLTLLKQEGITEPIQHHLTLLIHELTAQIANCGMALSAFEEEIATLNLDSIDVVQIEQEEGKIQQLHQECDSIQSTTSRALAVAWNTNRTDIIEKLSKIKEQSQKFLTQIIGAPRSISSNPTGLYLALEKRLDTVFISPDEIESIDDEEPVIEALVKFSVWYLKDYWEIGLLPNIHDPNLLDLDPNTHSERERTEYREQLFSTVESNLQKLGFYTLCDLKESKIYSKKALKDYIAARQTRLTEDPKDLPF